MGLVLALLPEAGAGRGMTLPGPDAPEAVLQAAAWRKVTSPNARDQESLMQVADPARSDPGLAGLILRCHDRTIEPVVVLLDPLAPGTKVAVDLEAGGARRSVEGMLLPTGAGLALPFALEGPLALTWRSAAELAIAVRGPSGVTRGVVSLAGLGDMLPPFEVACRQSRGASDLSVPQGRMP